MLENTTNISDVVKQNIKLGKQFKPLQIAQLRETCELAESVKSDGAIVPMTIIGKIHALFFRIVIFGSLATIAYSALQASLFERVDRITREQLKSIREKPINLFLTYRRSDTTGYTGRIYDRLSAFFGNEHVFMDLDKISGGENFIEIIDKHLESCDAIIIIIGKNWLGKTNDGTKIHDENDFVRYEIAMALQKRLSIFPILVNQAHMPSVGELPSDIAGIVNMQAIEITNSRWNYDVQQLIDAMDNVRKRLI